MFNQRKRMKIPKIVKQTAEENGCNSVNFVGVLDGFQVFGCSNIGKNGIAVPQGLPTLILLKDGKTKFVSGEEGLELAGRFQ